MLVRRMRVRRGVEILEGMVVAMIGYNEMVEVLCESDGELRLLFLARAIEVYVYRRECSVSQCL